MREIWGNDDFCIMKEKHVPTCIRFEKDIVSSDELLIEKEYLARVKGIMTLTDIKKLTEGVIINGKKTLIR